MKRWQTAPRQAEKLVGRPRQAQLHWWYHPQQRQLQVRAFCSSCASLSCHYAVTKAHLCAFHIFRLRNFFEGWGNRAACVQ